MGYREKDEEITEKEAAATPETTTKGEAAATKEEVATAATAETSTKGEAAAAPSESSHLLLLRSPQLPQCVKAAAPSFTSLSRQFCCCCCNNIKVTAKVECNIIIVLVFYDYLRESTVVVQPRTPKKKRSGHFGRGVFWLTVRSDVSRRHMYSKHLKCHHYYRSDFHLPRHLLLSADT